MGENSQDSKNPTEKPVGETEKKITDEYYCKCCFTFEVLKYIVNILIKIKNLTVMTSVGMFQYSLLIKCLVT